MGDCSNCADLREELDALQAAYDRRDAEADAAEYIGSAMATAIGWKAEGENWVEKAKSWRAEMDWLREENADLWDDIIRAIRERNEARRLAASHVRGSTEDRGADD